MIVGYSAIVDPQALGDRLEAFVELYCADSVAPGDLLESVAGLDAVIAAHTVAGDADAVVRVRVEGIEERGIGGRRRCEQGRRCRSHLVKVAQTACERGRGERFEIGLTC